MFFICKLFHSSRIRSLKEKLKIKIWRRPSKQSCTSDNLSSEVLLQIFKLLDSFEIVKIRPVCKKWLEVIEENRSLWRRPILPIRKNGWSISTIELFDRKSQSTLEEVSFSLPKLKSKEYDLLVQLLEKSKQSLRFLSILLHDYRHFTNPHSPIPDLSWKLPHLVEFKVSHSQQKWESRVLLRWNEFEDSSGVGSHQDLSSLKVLRGWDFPALFKSHLNLLNNISSLRITNVLESSEWRRILETPSKTLKHLFMRARSSSNPDIGQLSSLHFPRLKVLQTWSSQYSILPTWLNVPTTSTLTSEHEFPAHLPSISILCMSDLSGIQGLKSRCPFLVELEVGRIGSQHILENFPELVNELSSVLKERKQQSEEGFEVDGVKMTPLRRLVVPFNEITAEALEKLWKLVEEVVDIESVSPFIEIEV